MAHILAFLPTQPKARAASNLESLYINVYWLYDNYDNDDDDEAEDLIYGTQLQP